MKKILHGFLLMLEVVFAEHYFCENPKAVCCNAAGNSCPADGKTLLASPRSGFDRCGAVCHAPVEARDLTNDPGPSCNKTSYCCSWTSPEHCPSNDVVLKVAKRNANGCDLECASPRKVLLERKPRSTCINGDRVCEWLSSSASPDCIHDRQELSQVGKSNACKVNCENDNTNGLCCKLIGEGTTDCAPAHYFQNECGLAHCNSFVADVAVQQFVQTDSSSSEEASKDEESEEAPEDYELEEAFESEEAIIRVKRSGQDDNPDKGCTEALKKMKYSAEAFNCGNLFANKEKYARNTNCKGASYKRDNRTDVRINLSSIHRTLRTYAAERGCSVGFPDHYALRYVEKPAGKAFEMKAVRESTKIKWFYWGKKGCEEILVEKREVKKEADGKNKTKAEKTKREAGKGNGTNTTTKAEKIGSDELPRYRFVQVNNSLWNLFTIERDDGMFFSVQVVENRNIDAHCTRGIEETAGECATHIRYKLYTENITKKGEDHGQNVELHYTFYNLTVQTCANSDPCQHGKCVNKEEGTKNKPMITECDCLLEFGKEDCSEEKKEVIKIRLLYLASPFLAIIGIAVVVALITVICCDRGNRKERGYKPKWRKTIGVMAPDVLATLPPEAQAQQKRLETEAAAKAAQEEAEEAEAPLDL